MIKTVHKIFAMLAFLTIVSFFSSTLISELFFSKEYIVSVKSLIVSPGLFILIPSLILTGVSGNLLAKNRLEDSFVKAKKRRTKFIATIGILVLIPCALYLKYLSSIDSFDTDFYLIQAVELIFGAINIVLMSINIMSSVKKDS